MKAIFIEDTRIGGFTAFFDELPNIITEGETKEEALENLISLVNIVSEYEK